MEFNKNNIETIKDQGTPHNVRVSPDGKVIGYNSASVK